jgi:hypothetical protein
MGSSVEPYEVNRKPPTWWRAAIDAMPWEETALNGDALWYTKTAPCPRCKDADGIQASLEAEGWAGIGPEEETDVFVTCQCSGPHEHRPDGVVNGCGWGGYVAGPVK